MLLRSLEIKNYRSLEDVVVSDVGLFNVLVGRNNSGKSSVFGALQFLSTALLHGQQGFTDATNRVLSRLAMDRSLEISLTFEPEPRERRQFISLTGLDQRDPGSPERPFESRLLRKVSYVFRSPPGSPDLLHLRETKVTAEGGDWAVVQRMKGEERSASTSSEFLNFRDLPALEPSFVLNVSVLDIDQARGRLGSRMTPEWNHDSIPLQPRLSQEAGSSWLRERLIEYLQNAFFFDPFRRSEPVLAASETYQLTQTGSNLAQVLNTLKTNEDEKFEQVEAFVYSALPDVGRLKPTLSESNTRVDFQSSLGGYETRLHEMGGGVEQLLMAAVALLTTSDESTLFLEEPESHLHAGAQRYLIEKLYEGERQVFLTTHSPTFVNQAMPKSLYRVTLSGGATSLRRVQEEGELGEVLEDIGVRNSDVLLSDAVLFVEGDGDRDVLSAWAEKLGLNFAERNIAVLPMGGGEHVARGARPRMELLEGISDKSPVPHMFLVDRDERSSETSENLEGDFDGKLHILRKRELENYLLVPYAIRDALRVKHRGEAARIEKVEQTTDEEVQRLIDCAASNLRNHVLLNRIRAEVPGLRDGFMTREIATQLADRADAEDLPSELREALKERMDEHLSRLDFERIVRDQRKRLWEGWTDRDRRLDLAPGTEILEDAFRNFDSRYNKSKDAKRVAENMDPDEIPEEVQVVLRRVATLTDRGR